MTVAATTGTWDLDADRFCYFTAAGASHIFITGGHKYLLIAVNEITPPTLDKLVEAAEGGARILIDSGVFALTNDHMRRHHITMNEALALAPDQIDGFDDLFAAYLKVVDYLGDRAWGYIELDQGGMVNKRITRAKLEDHGVVPIPVYHPLNDGWDYFDELAESYDRMCVGNVVQADAHTRRRLSTTLWERHRQYPDLWVHLLGFTPDESFVGWPPDSADSSTWLGGVRWARLTERSLLSPAGVGVIVSGQHGCMSCRGVRKAGVSMVTSAVRGLFRDDPSARAEFLGLADG